MMSDLQRLDQLIKFLEAHEFTTIHYSNDEFVMNIEVYDSEHNVWIKHRVENKAE